LALQRGAQELFLLAGDENPEAQTFYRKLGFRASEVAFRKKLQPPPAP
jgi:ribosomal protein S18 acetylase RimI-like enzyme